MPVNVMIPTALRQYADGADAAELQGENVGQVLERLTERYPGLRPHLFGDGGELRSFVNVFVNDENIRDREKAATGVSDGDEVAIVPAVAGGQDTRTSDPAPASAPAAPDVELSKEEIERYSRHLIMPEVGMAGQKKLKASSVLLIGAGGLGAPLSLYLGAAGVGRIGIVDFDVVDHTNLQRQVIHGTEDVGRAKLDSARDAIARINPHVKVEGYNEPLTSENALRIIEKYDMVIDGTDNFPTRYLVNDACVLLGKPNVYGSIFRFDGQASVFHHEGGPCYRCLYPEPPDPGLVPSCAEGGVLGILPGLVGLIQATEGIKIMLGKGDTLSGRLLLFDALGMKFREMKIRRDPECPVCGDNPTVTELIDYEQFCGMPSEEKDVEKESEMQKQSDWDVNVQDLKKMRDEGADFALVDVREPHEYEICNLEGELIPLNTLSDRLGELDKDRHTVVHCRSGGRSAKAVNAMREAGFTNVWNLQGGILAWSDQVDPSVPKY